MNPWLLVPIFWATFAGSAGLGALVGELIWRAHVRRELRRRRAGMRDE